MTDPTSRDHWPRHARQWALVGPPLRPGAADVQLMEAEAAACAAATAGRPLAALILGVTPELVTMRWPADTQVVAVERSADVIGAIFPATAGAEAVVADWRALPRPDRSLDLVIGDGSLSNLAFPGDYRVLAAELARVLAPGGRVALRLFAAPDQREPLAAVAADLAAGRVGSMHALKWRIAMAIQPDDRNLAVADIGRAFDAMVPDRAVLAWDPAVIATIDVYRDSTLVYSFPTLAEVRAALVPLAAVACHTPTYELGDRCPTLVLTATSCRGGCGAW